MHTHSILRQWLILLCSICTDNCFTNQCQSIPAACRLQLHLGYPRSHHTQCPSSGCDTTQHVPQWVLFLQQAWCHYRYRLQKIERCIIGHHTNNQTMKRKNKLKRYSLGRSFAVCIANTHINLAHNDIYIYIYIYIYFSHDQQEDHCLIIKRNKYKPAPNES